MKTRADKEAIINDLHSQFVAANTVIVADYRGLKVQEMESLRDALRDVGAQFRVTKLTLARRALEDTPLTPLATTLEGPVGMAYTDGDPVGTAKALVAFAKAHPALALRAGILSGREISTDEIKNLATLPTLDGLRAQFLATLNAPAQTLVSIMAAAGGRDMVSVLHAKEEKDNGNDNEADAGAE